MPVTLQAMTYELTRLTLPDTLIIYTSYATRVRGSKQFYIMATNTSVPTARRIAIVGPVRGLASPHGSDSRASREENCEGIRRLRRLCRWSLERSRKILLHDQ